MFSLCKTPAPTKLARCMNYQEVNFKYKWMWGTCFTCPLLLAVHYICFSFRGRSLRISFRNLLSSAKRHLHWAYPQFECFTVPNTILKTCEKPNIVFSMDKVSLLKIKHDQRLTLPNSVHRENLRLLQQMLDPKTC